MDWLRAGRPGRALLANAITERHDSIKRLSHKEVEVLVPPILFEAIQFEKTIPDLAPKDKRPQSRTRVGAFHFFAQGRKMVEYMKSLFATTKLSISGLFSVSVDFLPLLHMAVLAQQSRLRLA